MSKKLEELFSLPLSVEEESSPPEDAQLITTEALSNLEKIDLALPQVAGLDLADSELDELARLAVDSYKDLQDLGMQVEARFSSEIFNSASTFLGHAITAKTAKINKKLKMIDLQLKKLSLDQKTASNNEEIEATPVGEARLLDRNEMLKALTGKTVQQ
jgi:hypothetical protein